MPIRRQFLTVTAAVLAASMLPGLSIAEDAKPVSGGKLAWGVETEPATLNPQLNGQDKTKLLLRNAYESLLARTAKGGYVPWLATEYKISEDGKTYTFKLRNDVSFTDGQKLNAEAIVTNFTKLKDAAYSGSVSAGPVSRIEEVKAVGDDTVSFTLKQVYAPFLDYVASLEILSPSAFASSQLKSGGPEIAGTGPFILKRYAKGQEIQFAKNPSYNWAPKIAAHQGPAYLDEVTYRFLPESSVRAGALTSGQVDVIEGISGNDAALFKENADFSYQTALNTGTPYSLFLKVTWGPTQDIQVRKALVASIDVDAVLKAVYRGERTRAWGITSPIDPQFYDKSIEKAYGADPKLANRLLDEAGWTTRDADGFRTKDGKRLTIEVVQAQATVRDQRDVLLQALQAQARQNAGIDLAIVFVDAGTYTDRRKTGQFGSIANSNTPTDAIDIEYHYLPLDKGGTINYSRAAAPELAQWLNEAASTLDNKKRFELYAGLQRFAIVDQAYALPLYEPEDQVAAADYVKGISFRPFKQLPESAYDIWRSE
ncbi:peptide/nickel transport system substrate-binding protein [Rhizobium leguminosarum]|uniref:Peptide/nickel transport system substrate-binding protein n=1 Tax=Rhizobium leguminosarum TaxID=384 RepID=A0AAE2MRL4_RHILE|nr:MULTISPECIES: ABC transporter substrate-binding protein [Rhizobium]MBB4294105.1 peptide/nickel transport system substrate-binding protein [Rhizobium leguminosarum]MBB4311863.1 peptide/nickel transport system substrate-binding protein [Rhizobium leguminosarum]MBB4420897.1 peptide/nickel transport system substrate-binding protein [Rhizobium leguminosarum]MBB4436071.1 peptide/nickel transport system substrate-binding protein [Rhizobium esperanzae]MBB4533070.1 peptide/nickel transport system su